MKAAFDFAAPQRHAACCCALRLPAAATRGRVIPSWQTSVSRPRRKPPRRPRHRRRTTGPEPSPAAAEMLKSMREKGLLTEDEYEELYRRQAKFEAQQAMKEGVPAWLRDWTFGGDVRFRYDRRDFGSLGFDQTYELGKQNIDVVSVAESRHSASTIARSCGCDSGPRRRWCRSSPSASASRPARDRATAPTSTTPEPASARTSIPIRAARTSPSATTSRTRASTSTAPT